MDIIGKKFGRLLVVGHSSIPKYVVCRCDCGEFKDIRATSLTKKKNPTRSCGCLQREFALEVSSKTLIENSKELIEKNRLYKTNFAAIKCEKPKNNTSGHKGVSWNKYHNKWNAYINIHGKKINLGYYCNIDDAVKARSEAEEKYFEPLLKMEKGK